MERKNTSRSKELNFIASFLKDSTSFLKECLSNPSGGIFFREGIRIEYGNIGNLIGDMSFEKIVMPKDVSPKFIYHIDRLPKKRKLEIELQHKLPAGSISKKAKADILIIESNGNELLISYKDSNKVSKLGQSSACLEINNLRLIGGHIMPLPLFREEIKFENSAFSEQKFNGLQVNYKKWAVFKLNHWKDFQELVERSLKNSEMILKSFLQDLIKSDDDIRRFLYRLLIGTDNDKIIGKYFVAINNKLLSVSLIINQLFWKKATFGFEEYISRNLKKSFLLYVSVENKKYYITKIEISYDGAKQNISQTKGIIYYFQEYSTLNNSYKNLFVDVVK